MATLADPSSRLGASASPSARPDTSLAHLSGPARPTIANPYSDTVNSLARLTDRSEYFSVFLASLSSVSCGGKVSRVMSPEVTTAYQEIVRNSSPTEKCVPASYSSGLEKFQSELQASITRQLRASPPNVSFEKGIIFIESSNVEAKAPDSKSGAARWLGSMFRSPSPHEQVPDTVTVSMTIIAPKLLLDCGAPYKAADGKVPLLKISFNLERGDADALLLAARSPEKFRGGLANLLMRREHAPIALREALAALDKGMIAPLARTLEGVASLKCAPQLDPLLVSAALGLYVPINGTGSAIERTEALDNFMIRHAKHSIA